MPSAPDASGFTRDPSAVEDRWRPLAEGERVIVPTLLGDAEALIRSRLPTLDARVTAGTLDPRLVQRVQVAMVKRVLSNPEGKRQESIDDYAWTRDNALSAGLLYLSDGELVELLPARPRARSVLLRTHSTPT